MKKSIIIAIVIVVALILVIGSFCVLFRHERCENRIGSCFNNNANNRSFSKKFQKPNNMQQFFNVPLNNKNQVLDYAVKLKLTDEQISKIKALIQKDNVTTKTLQEKCQSNMLQIREMEWSKNFIQATIDKLQKEITDTRKTLNLNQQKLKVDIEAVLTSEQLAQYKNLGVRNIPMPGIDKSLDKDGNAFYRKGNGCCNPGSCFFQGNK